jgi:hypothetical protein
VPASHNPEKFTICSFGEYCAGLENQFLWEFPVQIRALAPFFLFDFEK